MGRIQLNQHYVGVATSGQVIEPGTYDESDARLHGQAHYLVSLGIALWVAPPDEPTPPDEPPAEPETPAGDVTQPDAQADAPRGKRK